jgi:phospholipid/cholesterol/gamma-HCH transport system ATP-binding protein
MTEEKSTQSQESLTGQNVPPILELRNVHKRFGRLKVLRGVDLAIEHGRTLVTLGASGSGKSVMLKILIGLLRPDTGEVYFHGQRIDLLPEEDLVKIRKKIGFVFQMGALFDSMTVGENVAFALREHTNYGDARISQIVSEKLQLVGLDGIEAKMPAELSGGQRKRVAIARALSTDPEVMFFDEPTTGLDPVRSDIMNELILKLRRDLGVTQMVVTHDMHSAFKIADRMVMLYEGKLIVDGTAEQIRQSKDERVIQFVEGKASESDLQAVNMRR